jgi:hypothetical protein
MRLTREGLQMGAWQWALGIGEDDTPGSEAVDIGGGRLRVSSEASDPVVQVVDGDEEDIWSSIGLHERRRAQRKRP